MEKSIRQIALDILLKTNFKNEKAKDLINETIQERNLTEKDKAFLTELVYGTIRWNGTLNYIVNQLVFPKKAKKLDPEILTILYLSLYQIFYMDKVPDYAIVNESVEIAKKYSTRASGLVNAVLRRALRERNVKYPDINKKPVEHISAKYSHPEWMIKRWLERF